MQDDLNLINHLKSFDEVREGGEGGIEQAGRGWGGRRGGGEMFYPSWVEILAFINSNPHGRGQAMTDAIGSVTLYVTRFAL